MKRFFLLLLFISATASMFAQTTNPLDLKYQPPTTSVFGKADANNSAWDAPSDRKANSISLVMTDFVRMNARLLYERKLTQTLSATAGFGFSFEQDLIERYLNLYFFNEDNYQPYQGRFLTHLYSDAFFKSGYNISLSLKKYYNEDGSSSQYVNFDWKMANHQYDIKSDGDYAPTPSGFKVNKHYFTFLMGFISRSGKEKISINHDFSIGVGLKYTIYDKFYSTLKPVDLQTGYNDNWFKKQEGSTLAIFSPLLLIRYQLGIGW